MSHLSRVLQHFWNHWKEYLLELHEFDRMREEKGTTYVVNEGDIDTVHDEGHPRGLWQLGKIEGLVCGADGVVRGVRVRVMSKKGHPKTLRRPLQHIYPLEVRCEPTEGERAGVEPDQDEAPDRHDHPSLTPMETAEPSTSSSVSRRPTRRAAAQASDRILVCAIEFEDSCDCVRSHSTGGVCGLLAFIALDLLFIYPFIRQFYCIVITSV